MDREYDTQEEKERRHRLHNRDKSDAAKIAWKKHHSSYMKGIRDKEREMANKTLYDISKELKDKLDEADVEQDNVFENELTISFKNITGGIALTVNEDTKNISISTILGEMGEGNYSLENVSDLDALYKTLKDDLVNLCNNIDKEIQEILTKNGLKSTK